MILSYTDCLERSFFLIPNASNIEKIYRWMIDNKNGYNVNIENYSNLISHIAVQGPKSEEIIRKLGMEFPEAFTFIYTNSQKLHFQFYYILY